MPLEAAILKKRGVLAVGGQDGEKFLQGLLTIDTTPLSPHKSAWGALLTPQGRWLHDFIVFRQHDGTFLLDCEKERLADLERRLRIYVLRSQVDLRDASDSWTAAALWGEGAAAHFSLEDKRGAGRDEAAFLITVDPRLAELGLRFLIKRDHVPPFCEKHGLVRQKNGGDAYAYARRRMIQAVPEGTGDLEEGRSLPLENGFDALCGLDWDKGCYVGQEVTARMHYRGTPRRRLTSARLQGKAPAAGAALLHDNRQAGHMRSSHGDRGLVLAERHLYEAACRGEEVTLKHNGSALILAPPPWQKETAKA